MPHHSNAHIVLNVRDRTAGTYQSSQYNAEGQNIIQGQIQDVALSEVLFPYDIPNIQAEYNIFELLPDTPDALTIVIPPGFYSGAELAAAVTAAIVAAGAANTGPHGAFAPGDLPTCAYDPISNRFTFNDPVNAPFHNIWELASPYTYAANYLGGVKPGLGKDILSIMGFPGSDATGQIGTVGAPPVQVAVGGSAPLVFTQYIDICSPQLCKFQFFRDGTTTNLARRQDLICRLYVEDETSMPFLFDAGGDPLPTGTRPFVIHRQFKNQRVMRWTADNSVGTIDIQLYDDAGVPLTTSWDPRNFQLTFHAYELGDRATPNAGYY